VPANQPKFAGDKPPEVEVSVSVSRTKFDRALRRCASEFGDGDGRTLDFDSRRSACEARSTRRAAATPSWQRAPASALRRDGQNAVIVRARRRETGGQEGTG